MSQFSPRRISPDRAAPRYAAWPLLAVPALGAALAALGAFAVFATAGFASVLFLGDGAGPGQLASDYVNAHFPDGVFGFLTAYPPVQAACCALVAAATGLAAAPPAHSRGPAASRGGGHSRHPGPGLPVLPAPLVSPAGTPVTTRTISPGMSQRLEASGPARVSRRSS